MSDPGDGPPPGETPDEAPYGTSDETAEDAPAVGSVGEEAAKLLGALSEWARDPAGGAGLSQGLTGLVGQAADVLREVDEHVATGAPECTYCPVCRTVHAVRSLNPEVRTHLVAAGSSFLQAITGALASLPAAAPAAPTREPGSGFERIDLDDPGDGG